MGQRKIILGLLLTIFLVACTTSTVVEQSSKDNDQLAVGNVDLTERGVHRTVELEGEQLTVTLHVVLTGGARFYLFEEKLPVNAEFIDSDVERSGNSLKHVIFSDAKSTTYTYKLKVTQGTTILFDGVYAIDGMEKEAQIKGVTEAHI